MTDGGYGPVRRKEDARFIRGKGTFVDDIQLPGMLHGRIVRSVVPSARIVSMDTAAARAVPGVRAVLTAADVPVNRVLEHASGGLGELGGQGACLLDDAGPVQFDSLQLYEVFNQLLHPCQEGYGIGALFRKCGWDGGWWDYRIPPMCEEERARVGLQE